MNIHICVCNITGSVMCFIQHIFRKTWLNLIRNSESHVPRDTTHKGFMNIYVTDLHTQLSYLHYGFVRG